MQEKNKRTAVIVLGAILMVVTIGITYAFITQVLTGTKKVTITAGTLSLVLDEKNELTISDALPMYDAVGMIQDEVFTFNLINETSTPTDYILKLEKVEATNELSTNDVKYYLTKDGVGTPALLSSLSNGIIDKGTITGNDTIDYTLRLWIRDGVTDVTTISGKSLSYKVNVEATQEIVKEKVTIAGQIFEIEESTDIFPNFKQISSSTNGRGIYKYQEDGEDIYYWRGAVADNHIIFAGYCWEMVRTTKTGGIKIIYDGLPVEVDGVQTCPNTGEASQLASMSDFNSRYKSPAYAGYMYGNTVYEYQTKIETDTSLTTAGILYGYNVEWNGTEYTLDTKEETGSLFSSTGDWSTDRTSVANGNHYTCFDSDGSCKTVSYVYYTGDSSTPYYIDLTGGITIEKALEQMHSNEQPSAIKTTIETWFESTDLDEEEKLSKLEDITYCNDRSVADDKLGGWTLDGDTSKYMYYSSYTRRTNGTPDLSCRQTIGNRDRFTYKDIVNGNGLLKWPVGLLTADEIMLAGGQNSSNNDYYLYTGQYYWLLSPYAFNNDSVAVFHVIDHGSLYGNFVYYSDGIRPVVSLADGTEITGSGTETSPFEVK